VLRSRKQKDAGLLLLCVLLLAAVLAATAVGSVHLPVGVVTRSVLAQFGLPVEVDPREAAIVWSLRIPRVLLSTLVGAALAMSGAAMQGLFRNPLADPALIGGASGGAGGAVAVAVLGGSFVLVPPAAIVSALAVTWLVYRLGRVGTRTSVQTMLLAGLAINALAGAVIGFLIQLADFDQIRGVTFWLLGSLSGASWRVCAVVAVFCVPPLLLMQRQGRALNAMLLGEAEAWHSGFDVQRVKTLTVGMCAVMVGSAVAFCGTIGFVGLVVPHLARMAFGPDHRHLLPASALGGACLLILADLAARTLDAPAELPVGVLTALLGAPFFLYLIQTQKRGLHA